MLEDLLRRLSLFEGSGAPVISLYLNTQADQHGRDNYQAFVKKELRTRGKSFPPKSPERASYDQDIERIERWLVEELQPASQSAAIFACSADGLFEAIQTAAPLQDHHLYIGRRPSLYGLAFLNDAYRRYAAVVADTHSARIFVFGLGQLLDKQEISNVKTGSRNVGGWSQQRYQRHVEKFHQDHVKDLVAALDRVVREDRIQHLVLAGDEVLLPMLREQLPQQLAAKVVDYLPLDIRTPENEVQRATMEAMATQDAQTDIAKVQRAVEGYRAGGLAVIGPKKTMRALEMGQVDELLLSAALEQIYPEAAEAEEYAAMRAGAGQGGSHTIFLPGDLVAKAAQTGAKVSFIEDPSLLENVGGVAALLRFRVTQEGKSNGKE